MLGFLGSLLALALFGTAQGQLAPTYQTSRYTAAISNAPPMDTSVQTWTNITAADDRVIYVPLGFDFVFWNKTFNSVNVSSNGNIQFRTSGSGSANTLFAPTNAGATSYVPIIAIYQLDLVPTTDRPWSYRVAGTAPNRRFILRATDIKVYLQPNDPGLTCEAILTEGTNTIDIYYYNVPISTRNLEAGIQDSAYSLASSAPADWIYIWNDQNVSTPELAAQFNGKAVRYTPLNSVAPGTPEPLPTCVPAATYGSQSYRVDILAAPAFVNDPTATNMGVGDDRVDYTPIGFPFQFYGQTFNSVNISSNGNLQFTTSVSGSSASFFSTGVSSYAPAIAFFHADMKPALPEQRTYAVQGTAPNRRFVVRYNDVPYCCAAYIGGEGVIVDAVLYETTNVVELIYYRIPSGTRDVEAGLQNIGTNDWVSIYNDQSFTVPCNNTYSNKLFRFTPAGNASAPSSSSTGVPAASSVSSPVVVRSSSSTPAVLSSSSTPAVLSSSASVRSSSSTPAVLSSSSTPAVLSSSASVPSSSSAPVAPSSSSTGLPAPSSSSVPVVIDSSSSVPVVIDSSSSVPVSVESSTATDGPIDDPNLNGSASINSMVAFVVIAISMLLAL